MAIVCENFANYPTTTLAANVTISDTTIQVASNTGFPASPFRIMIDDEIMLVTAGEMTTTWTVTRAEEDTTAVAHTTGSLVANVFTQGSFNAWSSCRFSSDTRANLPAPGMNGRIYLTQGPGWFVYREDGVSWNAWGPTFTFNDYRNFDAINQTTFDPIWQWVNEDDTVNPIAGGNSENGSLCLGVGANVGAGTNLKLFVTPVNEEAPTSPPYSVVIAFTPTLYPADQTSCGVVFRDSATDKFIYFKIEYDTTNVVSNGNLVISLDKYDDPNTFNSNYTKLSAATLMGSVIFFVIEDDGTNLKWYFSNDGYSFVLFDSRSRTDFLTSGPDTIGFAFGTNNTTGGSGMNIYSWYKA